MNIKNEAKKMLDEVIEWRRYIYKNAEIGFDLENTVKYVCERLDEFGIEYKTDQGSKCSVIGMINPDKKGKTIAIRADMDALPVVDETGLEFRATDGKMHACGHDAHTAILLGVAKLLNEHKDKLNGRVKLIFQPAEELGTGSKGLVENGIMEDVDEIIALHTGRIFPQGKVGHLVFNKSNMMASMDRFKIKIQGTGAHGAKPEASKDPVVIGSYLVVALQEIISRELSPLEPAVITTGIFNAGTAFNIIPDTAELEGTVRAVSHDTREYISKRIGEIAEGVAKTFRASIEYEFFFQPPPVINDEHVTTKVMAVAEELYPGEVDEMLKPVMGGEDFAWYLKEKPGTLFLLHNPLEIDGEHWPHHNPKFALDEQYFDRGVAVMANYVLKELK